MPDDELPRVYGEMRARLMSMRAIDIHAFMHQLRVKRAAARVFDRQDMVERADAALRYCRMELDSRPSTPAGTAST